MTTEVFRAFRFTLAHTAAQEQKLMRWCGNARLAYNYAIAEKRKAHEQWQAEVQALVDTGLDKMEARKRVKVPTPRKPTIQKRFIAERGDAKKDVEGICPWYDEVASHVFQSGFLDADAAWMNWVDSYRGVRKGRRVGYPRFKKRGVAKDAFRLYHS
ncbi:helix-turn-helix domain-containing protein, partial [Streptomyces pratensis]